MGMPHLPPAGYFPRHNCSTTGPKAVRRLILWLWGKNRAVFFHLTPEFMFEASAHPLASFGLHFQFHVTQRTCGACFRVHSFTFLLVVPSEEEPIFPALSMVRVSRSAPSVRSNDNPFDKGARSRFHPALAMSQKCLVTGAAGFIGSHLVDRLLERDCFVLGVDNMKLGRRANLAPALKQKKFKFVELDVNDLPTFARAVRQNSHDKPFDIIWHMAANSDIRAGVADPDVDLRDTFLTTFNVLKVARELKIPQLAFASSSAIYGTRDEKLVENLGPLFPISNYGAMKLASEACISAALEAYLQRAWIFRFPNVVGSRSTHGVIYDFVRKLKANPKELEVLGDGAQEKPYFHVSDLLEAMLFIVERASEKLNYFNIGTTDSATTVRYIAERVVASMSPGAIIRYQGGSKGWIGDVPRFNYSIEKLQRLGWSPSLKSDAAVDRAVEENVAEAVR